MTLSMLPSSIAIYQSRHAMRSGLNRPRCTYEALLLLVFLSSPTRAQGASCKFWYNAPPCLYESCSAGAALTSSPRRMIVRRFRSPALASMVVAAMLGTVAACSSGDGSSDSDGAGSSVELRMTVWTSDPDALAMFDSIGNEFVKQHPEVSAVTFDSLTLDQLDTTITTGIQAGDPPDLSWLPVEKSLEYIQSDALVDLAPTLESTEGYNFDDLVPRLQQYWTDGDALYGVPF